MQADAEFMGEALKEARLAYANNEVPVGAVLVRNGFIIARAHNTVESRQDATAHAELLCLQEACRKSPSWRLNDATLYCTLEPCMQCAGAMYLSRLGTLVFAAPDSRHGVGGSWMNLLTLQHPMHTLIVRKGPYEEEAAALMKQFFKERRCARD